MPHLHRFYIPPETPGSGDIIIRGAEAHHALHVVRVKHGDPVVLFDGQGRELSGEVAAATKREVTIHALEERVIPPAPTKLTLLQSWLHRDKALDFVIQHGTEIGIAKFIFFRATRSERKPVISNKWTRTAVETCKQCARLWLPAFETANGLEDAIIRADAPVLFATKDLHATPLRNALKTKNMALLIGPEGDFTDEETAIALGAGVIPISLGTPTFRSEVAAMIAATLIQYELGQMGPLPNPG